MHQVLPFDTLLAHIADRAVGASGFCSGVTADPRICSSLKPTDQFLMQDIEVGAKARAPKTSQLNFARVENFYDELLAIAAEQLSVT